MTKQDLIDLLIINDAAESRTPKVPYSEGSERKAGSGNNLTPFYNLRKRAILKLWKEYPDEP